MNITELKKDWQEWLGSSDPAPEYGMCHEVLAALESHERLERQAAEMIGALSRLRSIVPQRPKAITWESGVEILDFVQDELFNCLQTDAGREFVPKSQLDAANARELEWNKLVADIISNCSVSEEHVVRFQQLAKSHDQTRP